MSIPNGLRQLMKRLDERCLLAPLNDLCREYNVTPQDVLGRGQTRRVSEARDAFVAQLYRKGFSQAEIAAILHRDPSGIHAAIARHAVRVAPP